MARKTQAERHVRPSDQEIGKVSESHTRPSSSDDKGKTAAKPPAVRGSKGRSVRLKNRRAIVAVCVSLAGIVWIVFGQTIHHEFVNFDDRQYVCENQDVIKGITAKGIVQAFNYSVLGLWSPLTTISHMLDCQLYGLSPGGHHLTNVLLHASSAILLFLVLWKMTACLWRSAFVAAVFAIHPLRVESVAWVAERKDMLTGLFFMLALMAYLGYARRPPSFVRYMAVAVPFALSLLAKPMLVTLPFVLLLLDYWPLNRFSHTDRPSIPWRLIAEKVPLLALSIASCVATFTLGKPPGSSAISAFAETTANRVGNSIVSYVTYVGEMFYPVDLAVFYPFPANGRPFWQVSAALVLLTCVSAAAFSLRRKHPWLLVGWLWYAGMLVPVAGIVRLGPDAHSDRYTYLPQIGLYLLLTWTVADLCVGWRHRQLVLGSLSATIIGALTICARKQTSYWQNSESLWTHALTCTSDNYLAHYNLGNVLLQKGSVNEAIVHFREAVQSRPAFAEAHNNLANAFLQTGQLDEAMEHYRKALEIMPDYAVAEANLGNALATKGLWQEAIPHYETAVRLKPDYAKAHGNLASALCQTGRAREAVVHFQKALAIPPGYTTVLNNFAWLLATNPDASLRNGARAVEIAQQACQLSGGQNVQSIRTLAAAYAEAGRFSEAVQTATRALQLARPQSRSAVCDAIQSEIRLYEASQPLREAK